MWFANIFSFQFWEEKNGSNHCIWWPCLPLLCSRVKLTSFFFLFMSLKPQQQFLVDHSTYGFICVLMFAPIPNILARTLQMQYKVYFHPGNMCLLPPCRIGCLQIAFLLFDLQSQASPETLGDSWSSGLMGEAGKTAWTWRTFG